MTQPENELKHALRRHDPPEGFAERVLARVAQQDLSQQNSAQPNLPQARSRWDSWLNFLTQPLLRWATAAAVSAALIFGGVHYRQVESLKAQRERAEGEAAKQQLVLALRIAGTKLQLAKAKVNQINESPGNSRNLKE